VHDTPSTFAATCFAVLLPRNWKQNVWETVTEILHNNMHLHMKNFKMTLETFGLEIMNHPPYCPDLASSGFHLFGPLKEYVGGQKSNRQ
jgi:hypothetical protein